jgi:hypothetical protein
MSQVDRRYAYGIAGPQEVVVTKLMGVVLIVLGVVALAYGGISYTRREKVVDIGPIEATAEKRETIPLPPLLGGLALAGGVVLLIYGAKSRA